MPAAAILMLLFLLFAPECSEAALSFNDQCIKWHNDYRSKHQVEAVAWNDTLAQGAANWAKYLADKDLFEHAKNIKEGENLYMTSHDSKELCTDATKAFYAEVKDYDYSKPGFSMKTGHFTQVVWKNTKLIGAAFEKGPSGKTVVVIRYHPPGNYVGEKPFRNNVLPPKDWQPPTEAGGAQICSRFTSNLFVLVLGAAFNFYV